MITHVCCDIIIYITVGCLSKSHDVITDDQLRINTFKENVEALIIKIELSFLVKKI